MRRAITEIVGADRLLYGDNFGGMDSVREDLTAGIDLSVEDREKIRWKNAAALLKIKVDAPGSGQPPK
jgi:aminocarboxymuconate-semialdehyde decarboxylase